MALEIRFVETWAKQTFYYVIIGILVGFTIVAFFLALNFVQPLFLEFLGGYRAPAPHYERHFFSFSPLFGDAFETLHVLLLLALLPAIGGLIVGLIKYKLLPVENPELHETDTFIDGFHNKSGILSGKNSLIRGICSVVTLGSGGSAGREGPSAMLGAAVGSLSSKFLKADERERRKIVAAAGGAGIAAIFKSPLGGAFFGIETLYKRDMEIEALVPAIICSITAYIVSSSFLGLGHLYAIGTYDLEAVLKPVSLLLFLILGVVVVPFVFLFIKLLDMSRSFFFEYLHIHDALKPAIGGLLLGLLFLIGYFFMHLLDNGEKGSGVAGGLFGGGYGFIQLTFYGELAVSVLAFVAVAKIVGTALTLGSGGSGGSFLPSLTIGAALGGVFGQVLSYLFPGTVEDPWLFSLIGAAAFLGAAANTPLTALFIVSEISGSYELFVPALLAIVPAYSLVRKQTVYPGQYELRKDSPAHRREFAIDILEGLKVQDAYTKDVLTIQKDKTVKEALYFADQSGHITFPVVDDRGKMIGITTVIDLEKEREEGSEYKKVERMCVKKVVVTYPDEALEDALRKMDTFHVGRLPVVKGADDEERKELLGIIGRSDIIREHFRKWAYLKTATS
ncbi:MAG: chloride channel protein [Candidatus Methanospirareceae archaeon]